MKKIFKDKKNDTEFQNQAKIYADKEQDFNQESQNKKSNSKF